LNYLKKLISPLFRRQAQQHLLYGKRHKALALFQLLYNWDATPENQFSLALCYMNLRDYQQACQLLQPIHDKIPDQLFAGITYAQCLLLSREYQAAHAIYQKLSDLNPQNQLLAMLITLSLDPVGRDKYVTSLDFQYQASILEEQKQPEQALELLKQALTLTPEDAALQNNLGALKLKLKYPIEEVMAAFARAMELNPENDRYKRNYRSVWQKNKR
jgi:tetratricopeptide (TPR) repeat protein